MIGKLHKSNDGWVVLFDNESLPLNPYDIRTIKDQASIFDNIEARILAYPDVHFEIELFWETGIEKPFNVATLKTKCYCGHTDYCDCIPEDIIL